MSQDPTDSGCCFQPVGDFLCVFERDQSVVLLSLGPPGRPLLNGLTVTFSPISTHLSEMCGRYGTSVVIYQLHKNLLLIKKRYICPFFLKKKLCLIMCFCC